MSDEDTFIRRILADPRDPALRLVYADWLEERGDSGSLLRAEYLRAECQVDRLPRGNHARRKLQRRLVELRKTVGDDWWQELDYAKVEYCVEFEYRCPQRWDTLLPTDHPGVRHCTVCQENVYYCRSSGEAYRRAEAGQCVAIDTRQVRIPLQLVRRASQTRRLLGKVAPRVPARLPLSERGRENIRE